MLEVVIKQSTMDLLLDRAGMTMDESIRTTEHPNWETVSESQKCISNIYLQSSKAISFTQSNKAIERVVRQMNDYDLSKTPLCVIEFDMRIAFLITAHCLASRFELGFE